MNLMEKHSERLHFSLGFGESSMTLHGDGDKPYYTLTIATKYGSGTANVEIADLKMLRRLISKMEAEPNGSG